MACLRAAGKPTEVVPIEPKPSNDDWTGLKVIVVFPTDEHETEQARCHVGASHSSASGPLLVALVSLQLISPDDIIIVLRLDQGFDLGVEANMEATLHRQ